MVKVIVCVDVRRSPRERRSLVDTDVILSPGLDLIAAGGPLVVHALGY